MSLLSTFILDGIPLQSANAGTYYFDLVNPTKQQNGNWHCLIFFLALIRVIISFICVIFPPHFCTPQEGEDPVWFVTQSDYQSPVKGLTCCKLRQQVNMSSKNEWWDRRLTIALQFVSANLGNNFPSWRLRFFTYKMAGLTKRFSKFTSLKFHKWIQGRYVMALPPPLFLKTVYLDPSNILPAATLSPNIVT